MKTKSYKTTITCTGCIDKVTPFLNEIAGEGNWEVNLRTKTKTLTINNLETTGEEIISGLKDLGYKAEEIEVPETEKQ